MGLNEDTVDIDFATGEGDQLVVFFSSSCIYCEQSLPVYQLVSDNCDPSMTLAFTDDLLSTMTTWWEANRRGFSEQCSSLTIGRLLSPPELYRVRGTPTHYLIGADGRVKHHDEGLLLEIPGWLDR